METFTGRVYKIVNSRDSKIYIGSTKQSLEKRMNSHKSRHKKQEHKHPLLSEHFDLHGVENFTIALLEEYKCKDYLELRKYEMEWQDKLKPELNAHRALRTPEVTAKLAREKSLRYSRKMRDIKVHCECGLTVQKVNMPGHVESKRHQQYLKDGVAKPKFTCDECGKTIAHLRSMPRHKKSKQHLEYIKSRHDM